MARLSIGRAFRWWCERDPDRPAGCENLEALPQRFEVMDADVQTVKSYIAAHCGG